MIESVDDFHELTDMIRLCDFYGMKKPLPLISHKLCTVKLSMHNLLPCTKAYLVLKELVGFTSLAKTLYERCVTFARANLASWQSLVIFIADNSTEMAAVDQVLRSVREKTIPFR